jgi:hypothetical protein
MGNFKFNVDDRAIKKAADDAVRKLAADLTRALNALTPRHQGKPLPEIKAEIKRVWAKHTNGGSITDPELTQFAEQIRDGGRIEVRMK